MEAARPASLDDLPALETLAEDARVELHEQRGGAIYLLRENRRQPHNGSLAAALDDPDQLVVAGTFHETVVGYGVVRLETLHNGERLAVVDDLYVDPEARGVGIGESVMDALIVWATGHGAIGIDSIALPGMRDTKNFFETFGLVARGILVHRSLRTPEGEAERAPNDGDAVSS